MRPAGTKVGFRITWAEDAGDWKIEMVQTTAKKWAYEEASNITEVEDKNLKGKTFTDATYKSQ